MINAGTASSQRQEGTRTPRPNGFSHISLPSRDLEQSKRFFTEVLGGELQEDGPTVRIQFADFAIALGTQAGGATAPHREHPHYAFTVPPEDFLPLKQRLEAYGVPTHERQVNERHGPDRGPRCHQLPYELAGIMLDNAATGM